MKNKILEYDKFIKNINVIVDTQEKVNYWILEYFRENGIIFQIKHLKAGDYAFSLNGKPQSIIIERKNSLTELSGNLKPGKNNRDRFYKEFEKIKKCEKYLIVENDSIDNLISGLYGTDFKPNSYIANLILLLKRENIQLFFVNRYNMGLWILKLFYYHYYELNRNLN